MFNRLKIASAILKNMGWRYTRFRVKHELMRRSGLLKKKFPVNPDYEQYITLDEWKKKGDKFFFKSEDALNFSKNPSQLIEERFQKIKAGKFIFFNSIEFDIGENYNWVTNPDSAYKYDVSKHWTEINDYSKEAGDIKYVWEKSRFSYLYDIIRYDYHFETDCSEFVFSEILSWIKSNPVNCGPNYRCSQETSLRVLNWTFALNYYRNSHLLTNEIFNVIQFAIYWQLDHIYKNIQFSRIAVRNNHAITETLTLYLAGLLYPQFPNSKKWKEKGKKWFEEEIAYQIYEDGTFLQFSMNYHRVVIQLFNFAFAITEKNDEKFSPIVYERAHKSLNFLLQCMEPSNGWLPNYGSNDGALFFKVSDSDYRDYRPQLNCLHKFLTGIPLLDYENDMQIQEEANWFNADQLSGISFEPIKQNSGWHDFSTGGYYLLREKTGLTFIRCGNHKDRPAQADNLHLDIWYKKENILYDGGTYKYNTSPDLLNYFMGTSSHNTVMLDLNNQMLKGNRFIWFNWSQSDFAKTKEDTDDYIFEGQIKAFSFLDKRIRHHRKIVKNKAKSEWTIIDQVINKPSGMIMKQIFHTAGEQSVELKAVSQGVQLDSEIMKGYRSNYYGIKEGASYYSFNTNGNKIETKLRVK